MVSPPANFPVKDPSSGWVTTIVLRSTTCPKAVGRPNDDMSISTSLLVRWIWILWGELAVHIPFRSIEVAIKAPVVTVCILQANSLDHACQRAGGGRNVAGRNVPSPLPSATYGPALLPKPIISALPSPFTSITARWCRPTSQPCLTPKSHMKFGSPKVPLPLLNRWVAWPPPSYYDAGPSAERLLGWHQNYGSETAAPFDPTADFRSILYCPRIMKLILETLDEQ